MIGVDNGDHHRDLLAAPALHQPTSAQLPDVLGLRAQHLGQGCAALHGHRDAVDEPGQRRQARTGGQPLQGLHQAGAGAGGRERAAQLHRQLALAGTGDPFQGADGPLPRPHAEGQELGHGGELLHHALLPGADLLGEVLVTAQDTDQAPDDHDGHHGQHRRAPGQADERRSAGAGGDAQDPPHHLFSPELLERRPGAGLLEPPPHRPGTTRDPLDPPDQVGHHRREKAFQRAEPSPPSGEVLQQPGPTGVTQVRLEPVDEVHLSPPRHRHQDEQEAAARERTEHGAEHHVAHSSTRFTLSTRLTSSSRLTSSTRFTAAPAAPAAGARCGASSGTRPGRRRRRRPGRPRPRAGCRAPPRPRGWRGSRGPPRGRPPPAVPR